MHEFTFEEMYLMSIYNSDGTRQGLITALQEMRVYLEEDEVELRELTDSTLEKLGRISDEEHERLYPSFEFF